MIEERAKRFGSLQAAKSARAAIPCAGPQGARAEGERGGRPGGPRPGGARSAGPRTGGFGGPRREGGFAPAAPHRWALAVHRAKAALPARDDRERRPFVRRDEGAPARPRNEFARPMGAGRWRAQALHAA